MSLSKDRREEERRLRYRVTTAFGFAEDGFYILVAGTLVLAGVILFLYSIYSFFDNLDTLSLSNNILELLDTLLLVFIFTELIYTIRTIISQKVLVAEPFLIVGIVAGIRRLVVLSAEVKNLVGTSEFSDAMLELSILAATIILLTLAVFLLRHTTHSEPLPAHEPGVDPVAGGSDSEVSTSASQRDQST
jgi:uncharacterized membrane protein (DUF373 family)